MKQTTSPAAAGFYVPLFSTGEVLRLAQNDSEPSGATRPSQSSSTRDGQSPVPVPLPPNEALEKMYEDRVRRARDIPPVEKLRESLVLFESVVARMAAGIRIRKPQADDAECLQQVRAQLRTLRRLQDRPVYMLIAGDGR